MLRGVASWSARGVWVVAAVLGTVAVLLAALWPREPLPEARNLTAREQTWSVPLAPQLDADAAISAINRRGLWLLAAPGTPGAPPARPDEPPLTAPDWRIVGTVIEGPQRSVLLATTSLLPLPTGAAAAAGLPPAPPQVLRVGDSLPGGARILEIRSDGLRLQLKGRSVFLSTTPQ